MRRSTELSRRQIPLVLLLVLVWVWLHVKTPMLLPALAVDRDAHATGPIGSNSACIPPGRFSGRGGWTVR